MTIATTNREYRELPLGLLDPPRRPSRAGMDEESLAELARDIRLKGLLVPLIVCRQGERYEIVAGHRRSIACEKAGLAAVMCCIFPNYEAALEGVKYTENRFREDLTAGEEAIWFAELLEADCGGDVDKLCEQLGESRTYVENRLLLFQGDQEVFHALLEKKINLGIAQQLNKCTDERMRRYFLDAAIRGGATATVVSGWIMDWKRDSVAQPAAGGTVSPSAAPSAVPQTNYFTCACCGGTDNVHLMVAINVHQHCKLAILDKLLAAYRGEGDA